MKEAKAIIANCLQRGWQKQGNRYYTPTEATLLKIDPEPAKRQKKAKRTGNTDDELNIRNKARHTDQFTRLIEIELGLQIWPEYYFTTERRYRLDYAIPEYKLAIEVQGGIRMKGNSGHSSGTGIRRDMDKANLLNLNGWTLLLLEPKELITTATIEMIKKAIENCKISPERL